MPIHEKSLIEPERILTKESLVVDGVDVSGHWNTMILPRTITNYDDQFEDKIKRYPSAANVHRCWQCGSCTNSCTVYALNTKFNPRYWIYLTRLGLVDEILKDKDIIWQCVSCNKCTNICPKDVRPEGVMKALAHWLEDEGHTEKRPSTIFDEEFWEQIAARGRIEEGSILMNFFKKTAQPLKQDWLVEVVKRMTKHLPLMALIHSGLHFVFKPKVKSWDRTGQVLQEYINEKKGAVHG